MKEYIDAKTYEGKKILLDISDEAFRAAEFPKELRSGAKVRTESRVLCSRSNGYATMIGFATDPYFTDKPILWFKFDTEDYVDPSSRPSWNYKKALESVKFLTPISPGKLSDLTLNYIVNNQNQVAESLPKNGKISGYYNKSKQLLMDLSIIKKNHFPLKDSSLLNKIIHEAEIEIRIELEKAHKSAHKKIKRKIVQLEEQLKDAQDKIESLEEQLEKTNKTVLQDDNKLRSNRSSGSNYLITDFFKPNKKITLDNNNKETIRIQCTDAAEKRMNINRS